jgi:hypothetical protein
MPYYRELVDNPVIGQSRVLIPGTPQTTTIYGGLSIGERQGYPVQYVTANNYAGLSTATNTDNERAVDTTAGDVVADAGFGGM